MCACENKFFPILFPFFVILEISQEWRQALGNICNNKCIIPRFAAVFMMGVLGGSLGSPIHSYYSSFCSCKQVQKLGPSQ